MFKMVIMIFTPCFLENCQPDKRVTCVIKIKNNAEYHTTKLLRIKKYLVTKQQNDLRLNVTCQLH